MLAVPDNDAIGSKHLDRSYRARAKQQPLKTIQGALAFEHQPHYSALRRDLVRSRHRPGP